MADTGKLKDAVEVLLEQLQEQEREVRETKKTINMLSRRMGDEAPFPDIDDAVSFSGGAIRPDEYYGKSLLTAVQTYLERGNKRARSAEEILNALIQGGFDFAAQGWRETDRLRSLSIALGKNPNLIHRLPNRTLGLTAWYDESVLRRGKAAREDSEEQE